MTLLLITYVISSFHIFVSPLMDWSFSWLFIVLTQVFPYQQFYAIVSTGTLDFKFMIRPGSDLERELRQPG